MPGLFSPGTDHLSPAQPGAIVRMNLYFNFGQSGITGIADNSVVVLAIYDLDQYCDHQASLPGGFRESNQDFFTGKQTQFPGALQDHTVRAGTGLLYLAEVMFRKKTTRIGDTWFIAQFASEEAPSNPAFTLELAARSAVEADGASLASGVVDLRAFATGGPDRGDYDAFTKKGAVKRNYTLRLLSSDSTRVLLSQLNPKHCLMGGPIEITYDRTASVRAVGAGANDPQPAPPVESTRQRLDVTGFYVQEADPADKNRQPFDIVSPAGLYVHQIGRAACGWYYPVPSQALDALLPDLGSGTSRLFPADIRNRVLSTNRMCFFVDERIGKTNQFRLQAVFDSINLFDPDVLVAAKGDPSATLPPGVVPGPPRDPAIPDSQRTPMIIGFEVVNLPTGQFVAAITLELDDGRGKFVFRRVWGEPRLAWSTALLIGQDSNVPASKQQDLFESLVASMVEPLPPGTLAALCGLITSQPMHDLVARLSQANPNTPDLLDEGQLNTGLERMAAALRTISSTASVPDDLVAQVRSNARHDIVTIDGNQRDMLSILEEISGRILSRRLAANLGVAVLPPGRPNEQDIANMIVSLGSSFDGFATFRIIPPSIFTYKFDFTKVTGPQGTVVVLKGSVGAFQVTVSKIDAAGNDVDPTNFPPTKFTGAFLGGGIGRSFSLGVGGISGSAASAGSPTSCQVTTYVNIQTPAELDNARFIFFAGHSPGAGVSAGPGIGISGGADDTIFSITLPNHVPPATLEAEISDGFKVKPTTPDIDKVKDYLKKTRDAVKSGDPTKVPAAQGNATLGSITLCGGMLFLNVSAEVPRPGLDDNGLMENLIDLPLETNQLVLGTQFRQGSAILSDQARLRLELKLAVLRKMLEYPGWMDVEGTASPEWSASSRAQAQKNNLDLSQFRAQAVLDAIFAAAGEPGTGIIPKDKDIRVVGKGAVPFAPLFVAANPQPGQHLDPLANPNDPTVLQDKRSFYPLLRRVDIAMNGVFALRIKGE